MERIYLSYNKSLHFGKKLFELVDLNYLKTLKKVEICIYGIVFQRVRLIYSRFLFSGFKFHENQLTFKETGNTDPYLKEASKFLKKILKIIFIY